MNGGKSADCDTVGLFCSLQQRAVRQIIASSFCGAIANDVSLEIAKLQWILVDLYAGFLSIK